MIEDQRLLIDQQVAVARRKCIVLDIPRRQTSSKLLQDMYASEAFRPIIQIFLIPAHALLRPQVAGLQAGCLPPTDGLPARQTNPESCQANVVDAAGACHVLMPRGVSMAV